MLRIQGLQHGVQRPALAVAPAIRDAQKEQMARCLHVSHCRGAGRGDRRVLFPEVLRRGIVPDLVTDQTSLLAVAINAADPDGTVVSVIADLSAVGGPVNQPLTQSSTPPDLWSATVLLVPTLSGAQTILTPWSSPTDYKNNQSQIPQAVQDKFTSLAAAMKGLTGLSTGNAIEAGLGAAWGEDPRYFQSPDRGFGARVKYVIKTTFFAPNRDEHWRVAYARHAGGPEARRSAVRTRRPRGEAP